MVPVFIFDTDILDSLSDRSDRRVEFICDSLAQLKQLLESHGSSLIVRYGSARTLLPQLADEFNSNAVFCNRDYEPRATSRDAAVAADLATQGRVLHSYKDLVIFEQDEILTQNVTPYGVFTPYKNTWLKKLTPFYLTPYPVTRYLHRLSMLPPQPMLTLEQIGFNRTNLSISTSQFPVFRIWK